MAASLPVAPRRWCHCGHGTRSLSVPLRAAAPLISDYDAPLLEDLLKGSVLIALVARGRVGFLVDAAVHGFAIGAGFALIENVTYLRAFGTAPWTLWLVRGLGTAMLHGGTTAIFGVLSRPLPIHIRGGGWRHSFRD